MQTLFFATAVTSVITLALIIRAVMLMNWSVIRTAITFMLMGGAAGYIMAGQSATAGFTEKSLGLTIPVDVLYIYFGIVLAGLISFVVSAIVKSRNK